MIACNWIFLSTNCNLWALLTVCFETFYGLSVWHAWSTPFGEI